MCFYLLLYSRVRDIYWIYCSCYRSHVTPAAIPELEFSRMVELFWLSSSNILYKFKALERSEFTFFRVNSTHLWWKATLSGFKTPFRIYICYLGVEYQLLQLNAFFAGSLYFVRARQKTTDMHTSGWRAKISLTYSYLPPAFGQFPAWPLTCSLRIFRRTLIYRTILI